MCGWVGGGSVPLSLSLSLCHQHLFLILFFLSLSLSLSLSLRAITIILWFFLLVDTIDIFLFPFLEKISAFFSLSLWKLSPSSLSLSLSLSGSSPCGMMAKELDSDIVVSEFELQLCYCIHFRTNTLGEKYEPLYLCSSGLYSTFAVLLQEWLWH